MFQIQAHDHSDKSFGIHDNELDFYLSVDYDDVNHEQVDLIAHLVTTVLNEYDVQTFIQNAIREFDERQQREWESKND